MELHIVYCSSVFFNLCTCTRHEHVGHIMLIMHLIRDPFLENRTKMGAKTFCILQHNVYVNTLILIVLVRIFNMFLGKVKQKF